MPAKPINLYVAGISVLSVLALSLVPWGEIQALTVGDLAGLLLLMGFILVSERLSVSMSLLPRGSHTITFIPLMAAVLLFGPVAPVILMGATGVVAELLFRKKEAIRAVFNVAQYLLSTSIAGWVFSQLGGTAAVLQDPFTLQLGPFAVFLVVVLGINQGTVFLAIALSQELRFKEVFQKFLGPSGVNVLYDISVSPIALVVVFFYMQAGWASLVLTFLPLLFIRHAYLNNFRLEQANRDLLRAIVKAIETRDPYTSGHSQRVSALAGRIARHLNLSPKRVEAIEMAALFHDVGKIDSVYSDILRKPDSLTDEEREIMESHVMKGVEFLRSMSSVPDEVITGVRSHHEREDGRGYPDKLLGPDIPLAAKVIKVCDSIDAMLSDRPYRRALTLAQVKSELDKYSGVEFDVRIAQSVLASSILEDHAREISGIEKIHARHYTPWKESAGYRSVSNRLMSLPLRSG